MLRAKSDGGGTITFTLAHGAARQICRLTTTFQTGKQAFSYLHKYRPEFERISQARALPESLKTGSSFSRCSRPRSDKSAPRDISVATSIRSLRSKACNEMYDL